MNVDEGIQSDKEIVESLFERDPTIRQIQLVIDWLEQNELDDLQDEAEENKIEFYSEGNYSPCFTISLYLLC